MRPLKTLLVNAAFSISLVSVGFSADQTEVPENKTTSQEASTPADSSKTPPPPANNQTGDKVAVDKVSLDTVVVSASGFKQHIIDAPASISVVSAAEIQEMQVSNIADALQGLAGIDVEGTVGKTGNPTISFRGMPSDYTLILIDGRRQNSAANVTPNGFGETATAFMPPPNAIERIEVVRGPMSTLYGSDAIGGVVNIITKKVSDKWGASVTYEGTAQFESEYGNQYGTSVYTSGPIIKDRLGLTLRGSYLKRQASDIHFTADDGNSYSINDASVVKNWQSTRGFNAAEGDIWSFGGRVDLIASEDHNFWVDSDWARQVYDNSNSGLGTLDTATVFRGYKDTLRFNRDQYAVGWDGDFGIGKLTTSFMYNDTETLGRTLPTGTFAASSPMKSKEGSDRELNSGSYVVDAKFVTPIGESHMLTTGMQYWFADMKDGISMDPNTGKIPTMEGEQWSLFAEDEWSIFERLALTLGLRYDNHNVVGDNFSPRAYLVWKVTDYWALKGGVAQGFKTPAINSFYNGIVGVSGQGTRFIYGNPDLDPEKSTSGELGFIFDNKEGFSFGATGFYTDFKDKISSEPFPGDPTGMSSWSVNVSDARAYGAETYASYTFLRDWTVSANYTWTQSEYRSGANKGDKFENTPDHAVNARISWRATEGLTFWMSGEFRSKRARDNDTSGIKDSLGDYQAYQLYHLGASYQVNEWLTLNAAIYNLFDKDFVDYDSYVENGTGATYYTNTYNNIYERRRLWLSATMSF